MVFKTMMRTAISLLGIEDGDEDDQGCQVCDSPMAIGAAMLWIIRPYAHEKKREQGDTHP